MTYQLFSYYDKVTGAYLPLISTELPVDGFVESARRTCLKTPEKVIQAQLQDCQLFHFGTFDDQTGEINVFAKPDFKIALDQFLPRRSENVSDANN